MTKLNIIKTFLRQHPRSGYPSADAGYSDFASKNGNSGVTSSYFKWVFKQADQAGLTIGESNEIEDDKPIEIDLVKIKDIKVDNSVLIPIKTDTPVDAILSNDGGLMPATIMMVPGESGVGKSTVLLDILGKAKKKSPKKRILFISTEMNRTHLFKYSKRVDFTGVEILLLGEYIENRPHRVVEQIIQQGWDLIMIDSFQDCIDKCKDSLKRPTTQCESWLLSLMDRARSGQNEKKLYTNFTCVQHMTKGAVYVGSTKLKHMTDAMMELKYDKESGEKYIEFTKNRDGEVYVKLYFDISNDGVTYNQERFERDKGQRQLINKEKDTLTKDSKEFEKVFGTRKNPVAITPSEEEDEEREDNMLN